MTDLVCPKRGDRTIRETGEIGVKPEADGAGGAAAGFATAVAVVAVARAAAKRDGGSVTQTVS